MESYIKYTSNSSLVYHQELTDSCTIDIHIHDSYEIYQALSNNIRYFVEGETYDLNAGDIIITSSREIHRPITLDNNPYSRRFIQFDPSIVQSIININYNPLRIFEHRTLGQNNHIVIPNNNKLIINSYFQNIAYSLTNNTPRDLYKAWSFLLSLLVELEVLFESSNYSNNTIHSLDPRIYKIKNYLDKHYTKRFNLDELSKIHLIDKYYMSRLFKEITGFTILEYVQSKRIKYAKTLLAGNQTILEISQQCGYDDYTNFYKTFKKLTKMSPKEYRDTLHK